VSRGPVTSLPTAGLRRQRPCPSLLAAALRRPCRWRVTSCSEEYGMCTKTTWPSSWVLTARHTRQGKWHTCRGCCRLGRDRRVFRNRRGPRCRIWGCLYPSQSYRYTVAMFPLPYKNVLKYRTRQNVGGISILASNTKCTRECRPHFAACGTPDRAAHEPVESDDNDTDCQANAPAKQTAHQ
jgi:hypothetical protein